MLSRLQLWAYNNVRVNNLILVLIILAYMGAQTPIAATATTDKLLHVIYIKFSQ
jgi:hypothetical protein